jgi:hypothetical protein
MNLSATPAPKPYLYAEELAALTPWSVEAIRKKVQRGELRLGLHYFQEARRGRLIFKWAAIVELIECGTGDHMAHANVAHGHGKVLDVAQATTELRRLLS